MYEKVEDAKGLNLFTESCGILKGLLNHILSVKYLTNLSLHPFHEQILKCWFSMKSKAPENKSEILNEYIFENVFITINNKPLSPKDFGLDLSSTELKIVDIINNDNKLCTPTEFAQKFKSNINILHIFSMLGAIPKIWKTELSCGTSKFSLIPAFSINLNKKKTEVIEKLTSKKIYCEIINSKTKPATSMLTNYIVRSVSLLGAM